MLYLANKESHPGRGRRRTIALLAAVIGVSASALAIEALVRLAAANGWVRIQEYQVVGNETAPRFLADLSPVFGVWHLPNAVVNIQTPNGVVTYETNDFGMRDRARTLRSTDSERVVVLGDSFVEGFMVEESQRFTDLLEGATGVEFLNFGTSGGFGPVQEWLLYEDLARRFDHSRVVVFLLPDNDFDDMAPERNPANRYRPYLRRSGKGFDITYPIPFGMAGERLRQSPWTLRRNLLFNSLYSLNLVSQLDVVPVLSRLRRSYFRSTIVAPYDSYSREDFERLSYAYDRTLELAGDRSVTIFVIPREKDFLAFEAGQLAGRISEDLLAFAKTRSVKIVDMLPEFLNYMRENHVSHTNFFLGFDPHWSPLGHRVAAGIVLANQPFLRKRVATSPFD